jgi:hypothetical protein
VYYNAGVGEVEEYLWTMWREQHGAEGCAAPQSYALYVAPEGDCPGKVRYVFERAVLKSLDFPIKPGEVAVISATWGGRRVWRLPVGTVEDNFNRPNEGPPPSFLWATVDGDGLAVIGNVCGTAGAGAARWQIPMPTADCLVSVEVSDVGEVGNSCGVHARGDAVLEDGYRVVADTTVDSITLYRVDDGVMTSLASDTQAVSVGDRMGIRLVGDTISAVYRRPEDPDWTTVVSDSDDTYSTAGYVGLAVDGALRVDNFIAITLVSV